MNKSYNKNELGFAIFWIVAYIVFVSIADGISAVIGIEKIITVFVLIAMTAMIDVIISLVIIIINVTYTLILLKLLPSDKDTQSIETNN